MDEPITIVYFRPFLKNGSEEFKRAWELLIEMNLHKTTVTGYTSGDLRLLGFCSKADAIMFRMRL